MKTVLCLLSGMVILLLLGYASMAPASVTQERFDYASLEPAAAKVRPPTPQALGKHSQAAQAALIGGDMETASRKVKLALQDNPRDALSHFLLGCLLERKGEHDQAIVAFQRSVAIDPTNPDALYNLGTMLLWRGELVPASRQLENAILIRPDHIPSRNNVAKAYFQVGLPELAVASYEEVLSRDSSNAIALNNLLLLAEATGNHDAAATYRQRLKALGQGRTAKSTNATSELITQSPTWPVVRAVAGSPLPTLIPVTQAPQPPPDKEVDDLRQLLRDLPHVTVERRGGRIVLTGWTSGPKERIVLDRVLGKPSAILDLTTDDTGDPQRMVEFDAVLFIVTGVDQTDVGFNFLRLVDINFNYFASDNKRAGTGFTAPPAITGAVIPPVAGPVTGLVDGRAQQGWIFSAAVAYSVNIANASNEAVAVLARPHLTTLNGTPARFLAGGELIYRVSGLNSGDIKPYPFGTSLSITPTLLRTPAEDGVPRVHVKVEAGRTSILSLLSQTDPNIPSSFTKVTVTSEAVLSLGQTLILSGLSQREANTARSGVPVLRDIPILRYFFSTKTTVTADSAVIILLTPRDPAFSDELNRKALDEFIEMRRAWLKARQGTEEDMRRFRERYPNWQQVPPNRFASHLFMMQRSELYRAASGYDLKAEDPALDLLGPTSR